MQFSIKLFQIKKAMNQIKDAIAKNESIPVMFGDYMGQIILAKNKVLVINPNIFVVIEAPVKITGEQGICVPDEFFNFIDKVKTKGVDKGVNFELNGEVLSVSIDTDGAAKTNTTFSVKIIPNVNDVIPTCSSDVDASEIPERFHNGIAFCEKTTQKSKETTPFSLVWMKDDKIFSSDNQRISIVEIDQEFLLEFGLSQAAIKTLKNMEVNEYAVDKRWAFFYGAGVECGFRQHNFTSLSGILDFVENFKSGHFVKIPGEILDKMPEIKTINDKKKSPFIEFVLLDGEMTVISQSNSPKTKSEIIVKSPTENDVDCELNSALLMDHFESIMKIKNEFEISEDETLVRVVSGDDSQYALYTRAQPKV